MWRRMEDVESKTDQKSNGWRNAWESVGTEKGTSGNQKKKEKSTG